MMIPKLDDESIGLYLKVGFRWSNYVLGPPDFVRYLSSPPLKTQKLETQ